MIKDEESSSLTRRYYRCKQSETGVFWGGKGGRASTCGARDTGAKEGSGGRRDGRVFPPHPYSNVRSFFQSRVACTAAKETASSSLHCMRARSKTDRSPARKLTIGGTRYGMGRVYGASAFNPLLGFQDIYLH